jgi:predicted phosphodiesterase
MPEVKHILEEKKPDLYICGHSHILKVIYDKKLNLLHVNPGAAGNSGFHKKITFIRMVIDGRSFKDMEIFELDRYKVI